MIELRILFLILIVSQSVLFGQKDSTKKNFKPYGLIDAAPVAINKNDFKPPIILTIEPVDAITNAPVNAKLDYYTVGDGIIRSENGKVISLTINGNQKIIIVSNAQGYIWQTQIFNTPISDTSYVLKLLRINKGDNITKQTIDLNLQNIHSESYVNPEYLGLKEFLNLNKNVKIQVSACPEGEIRGFLIKNIDKRRFCLKKCKNSKQTNFETITLKILKT
ncbi:MAG: hypothetical protein K8R85_16380 [Bacteroidetes bacterium]|nr:hypothetical protein [Bacteroidota bacterium]